MSYWESRGKSDEWYTPQYLFDAMEVRFDLDPANGAEGGAFVPCIHRMSKQGLERDWGNEFVWLNPPFGGRNGLVPWIDKFFSHGNGVLLTPDRTSAPWWQHAALRADAILFVSGKIKFIRPDGQQGKSPSNGTCLFAAGEKGVQALVNAQHNGLGYLASRKVAA